jgi:Calcineurin-like phosphoesterase
MNLWCIPDIHARFDLLAALWNSPFGKSFNPNRDILVYLGDMIDRGFQAAYVLTFIKKQTEKHPFSIFALMGNHEDFLLKCYQKEPDYMDWALWLCESNGGKTTHASLMSIDEIQRMSLVNWVRSLPKCLEFSGFFFSHAPVPREKRRKVADKRHPFTDDELTWSYSNDEPGWARNFKKDDGKDIIGVCGHIHALKKGIREPRFYDHYIYADAGSGCHPKAPLVAIEVKSRKWIGVDEDGNFSGRFDEI